VFTNSTPASAPSALIHTVFGEISVPESSYPSFARSLLFHALVIGLAAALIISKPPLVPSLRPNVKIYVAETLPFVGADVGGGRHEQTPASIGVTPPTSRTQITPPRVELPAENPLLAIIQTVAGPPRLQVAGEIGSPTGREGPKSNGRGNGNSIGDGSGNSVGDGDGSYGIPGHGGVSIPRAIYMPDPEYSEEARKARHQGTVTLWVVLNAQGRIEKERIYQSLGMGLDEQALAAVRTWRFEPATRNGQPIPVQMYVDVTFRLY
jgi:TonB family protein